MTPLSLTRTRFNSKWINDPSVLTLIKGNVSNIPELLGARKTGWGTNCAVFKTISWQKNHMKLKRSFSATDAIVSQEADYKTVKHLYQLTISRRVSIGHLKSSKNMHNEIQTQFENWHKTKQINSWMMKYKLLKVFFLNNWHPWLSGKYKLKLLWEFILPQSEC